MPVSGWLQSRLPQPAEVLGANTLADLAALDATMRAATASRLMAAGVTIFRPDTCVIDAEVEVEPDTIIEPFVQLLGRTKIGAECHIRSYSVIENCTLGNNVIVRQSCVLAESTIAAGAEIGPFARIAPRMRDRRRRPHWQLRRNQKIQAGPRRKGGPSGLPGRCRDRCKDQHRRRRHHLQLRRSAQAQNAHRRGSFCGQRLDAGRSGSHRRSALMSALAPASPRTCRRARWL